MTDLERQFVRAVAYCLGDGDRHVADAEWALGLREDPPPAEIQRRQVALVTGGATKIKEYVFESARLPEIRGASALLDRINLRDVRGLWNECPECVVYANGGEVLAFAPVAEAPRLVAGIEAIYARETLVAQSVAVWRPFSLRQLRHGILAGEAMDDETLALARGILGYDPAASAPFGSLVAALSADRFRRREGNPDTDLTGIPEADRRPPRVLAHFETVPFARRCSSCERRAAVVNARTGDEDRPLCEPCARKRVYGQRAKKAMALPEWWTRERFAWEPGEVQSWAEEVKNARPEAPDPPIPEDLNAIGEESKPEGFIGVVYADGNNMGALLEQLGTPAQYRQFADCVYDATKKAVFDSLDVDLPFEILSIGGDDFFLIVPGHDAIRVACTIATKVEEALVAHEEFRKPGSYEWGAVQRCEGIAPEVQCQVSLSAGVVIADAHTPIFYLADLAGQLLKSAKQRAKWLKRERGYYGGTVDFMALKSVSTISGKVEDFRRAALTLPGGRRLFARPYTIKEMEVLLESIRFLKSAEFPRSQLYRLRDSLRTGEAQSHVDYLYFLSRNLEKDDRKDDIGRIERLWTPPGRMPVPSPWRPCLDTDARRETIWHDLVELYDFVSVKESGNGRTED